MTMTKQELLDLLEEYMWSWVEVEKLQIPRLPGDVEARQKAEKRNNYLYKKLQYEIAIFNPLNNQENKND